MFILFSRNNEKVYCYYEKKDRYYEVIISFLQDNDSLSRDHYLIITT